MKKHYFLVLFLLFIGNGLLLAQQENLNNKDSITTQNSFTKNESHSNMSQLLNEYSLKSEIDHQKLLRNIFAISFIFVLLFLLFIIFFYGTKINKINQIILTQTAYLHSSKDQLQKIIRVFDYMEQWVFITNADGKIEWINKSGLQGTEWDYEKEKINLLSKFQRNNQAQFRQAIAEKKVLEMDDNIIEFNKNWRMIPIDNSKGDFSNMVFIAISL